MERYCDQELGSTPHIVILGSCKVGNFVVTSPIFTAFKAKFPNCVLGYIGSDVTRDLEINHPSIDWRASWDCSNHIPGLDIFLPISARISQYGQVDLAVNLDGFNPVTQVLTPLLKPRFVAGFSLSASLRSAYPLGTNPRQTFLADTDWDSPSFLNRYSSILQSNYLCDIFSSLCYLDSFTDSCSIHIPHEEPDFIVPQVLIHCTSARSAKMLPFNIWSQIVEYLTTRNISCALIGSAPKSQQDAYNAGDGESRLLAHNPALIDLRGKTNLLQLAGACRLAQAVISVDAGPLHISAASGTPTLAVVGNDSNSIGASPIRLWLPRSPSTSRTVSASTCTLCADNCFKNDDCLLPDHVCMTSIPLSSIFSFIDTHCV